MNPPFDARLNIATLEQADAAVALAIDLATSPGVAMRDSAQECAEAAAGFLEDENAGFAHEWACQSLAYSVGIFSEHYIRLQKERRA